MSLNININKATANLIAAGAILLRLSSHFGPRITLDQDLSDKKKNHWKGSYNIVIDGDYVGFIDYSNERSHTAGTYIEVPSEDNGIEQFGTADQFITWFNNQKKGGE